MKKDTKKTLGFTLIELLITITITAIFFAITFSRNTSFIEQRKLSNEAQKFTTVLDLARKKALASDGSIPCTGEFLAIRMQVNQSNYQLKSHCLFGDTLISTYSLTAPLQVSSAPQTIDFKLLSSSSSPSCIIIKNTSINSCYNVNIAQAGTFTSGMCSSCGTCCSAH